MGISHIGRSPLNGALPLPRQLRCRGGESVWDLALRRFAILANLCLPPPDTTQSRLRKQLLINSLPAVGGVDGSLASLATASAGFPGPLQCGVSSVRPSVATPYSFAIGEPDTLHRPMKIIVVQLGRCDEQSCVITRAMFAAIDIQNGYGAGRCVNLVDVREIGRP